MILLRDGKPLTDRAGAVYAPAMQPAPADLLLYSHGDSLFYDQGANNFIFVIRSLLASEEGLVAAVKQRGINGISWDYRWPSEPYDATMIEDAPLTIDPVRRADVPSWLHTGTGTNGITLAGNSAATEAANAVAYLGDRIADGQVANRIVVYPMLPRSGVDYGLVTTYNAALVSGATGLGCRVARVDQDPDIGAEGQNLNGLWFYDGIHLTVAGQARFGAIGKATMYP